NLTKNGFNQGGSDKYISNVTYAKHIVHKPNIGDVLLTKDGTVGVCYVVDSQVEGIVSSGIVKLLPIDETIPKEYLSLVINSKLCQMQIQRDCSGALIVHWKPEDIKNLKIPILSEETMNSLANIVTQSKQALKQSKQLLEDAKAKVEALIEEASR
ncbi:MAG: restriction endonuclease subunit S, partial [Campylobacterales bacterium]|nr:restriction endonuclease subunit S [Campylobacterales bacterium]